PCSDRLDGNVGNRHSVHLRFQSTQNITIVILLVCERTANTRCADAEHATDLRVAQILLTHLARGLDALGAHHGWAAADAPLRSSELYAAARVLSNHADAQLGERREDLQHGLPHRRRRVYVHPRLIEAQEAHAARGEALNDVDGDRLGAGYAIERGYHQLIAGAV